MRRWTIVKALTNVTLFFLFIVLPIVGIVYFFDWVRNTLGIDLDQFKQAWEGLMSVGETSEAVGEKKDQLLEFLSQ